MLLKIMQVIFILMISILFITSGLGKIASFNKTSEVLHSKMLFKDLPIIISKISLVISIILVIGGPLLMLVGIIFRKYNILYEIGCWMLITFTILASIFFHPITDMKQRDALFKNLAIIGGLGLAITNKI